ncbi:hypothetical protein PQX77_018276 [Marasmius sp. AFHP31]|nr:hypothetical protein PQX77_018276 [Marasmius sp. AFHP31]
MPSAKRRRLNDSLADSVNIISLDDDDNLIHHEYSGEGQDYWTRARAQLTSVWDLLTYQRRNLFDRNDGGFSFSEVPIYDPGAPDNDEWNDVETCIPVGEEGATNSHAGGEYDMHSLLTSLLDDAPKRIDMRDRRDRTERQTEGWRRQLPRLVDGYLWYQTHGIPDTEGDDFCEGEPWTLRSMDFYDYRYTPDIRHVRDALTTNETLAYFGYIGGSPESPTIVFPFQFLKSFRQIHRRFPMPHLEQQLRTAYDAYLLIKREVQSQVDSVLARDPHDHFIRNVCPPCTYQLDNELELNPSILMAMDGNNSLKLVDVHRRSGQARIDTRFIKHPRWLDADFVDLYQDEVAKAQQKGPPPPKPGPSSSGDGPTPSDDSHDMTWLNDDELNDLADLINPCVERWKAAGPESHKKMFSFFSVSGIFLSVCRHGHVLVVCDMRKSGELMKYPLAIVKALLDRYGRDLGLGYDIMCAFYRTLLRSEKLHDQVVSFRLKGVVPAFHGHAHNRKCQVSWHPMYTEGVGLEDFEECERTFSESNHLAATTRLASEFHRHQALMEHFDFHDQDKHMASDLSLFRNFIYQNYRQALERIAANQPLYQDLCQQWGVTDEDCEQFLRDERAHFSKEHQEPPEVKVRLDYVELLQKLTRLKSLSDEAHAKYKNERYKATLEEVLDFENKHSFYKRWEPTDKEYQETGSAMRGRHYRRALEQLERLVVQRLLELTKLNMSGVGYKQHEKITQALRACAKAIQKALDDYNESALSMDPPRPRLQWTEILDMVTLADFDLLKEIHLDLTNVPWAQPHNRECVQLYFRLKRAREEINRLNVEIRRLISFMIDEMYADHYRAWMQLDQQENYPLAIEVWERMRTMVEIDGHIAIRLVRTSKLHGFTGTLVPGRRKDRDPSITDSAPLPAGAPIVLGLTRTQGNFDTGEPTSDLSRILPLNDDQHTNADGLIDYFEEISILRHRLYDDVNL